MCVCVVCVVLASGLALNASMDGDTSKGFCFPYNNCGQMGMAFVP